MIPKIERELFVMNFGFFMFEYPSIPPTDIYQNLQKGK